MNPEDVLLCSYLSEIVVCNYLFVVLTPVAYGHYWARDQTRTTAVTQATALKTPDSYPGEPQENSCHFNFKENKTVLWQMNINKTDAVRAP